MKKEVKKVWKKPEITELEVKMTEALVKMNLNPSVINKPPYC